MMDDVAKAQARRWTAQLIEALVAVVRAEVPQDERAGVLDDMGLELLRQAEVERRGGPYVAHAGSPEVTAEPQFEVGDVVREVEMGRVGVVIIHSAVLGVLVEGEKPRPWGQWFPREKLRLIHPREVKP